MEDAAWIWIVVGAVVLVAGVAGIQWYLRKKRREELSLAARKLGLDYVGEDTLGLRTLPFELLERGDGRGVEHVMTGTWEGLPVTEFDYWYYDETTDAEGNRSRTYYRFSCLTTRIEAACSPLEIVRENVITRMADALGLKDIDFELEAFNRAWQVKGKDRRFAYAFVDARMMQWLLDAGKGWGFEVSGPYVLVYSKRRKPRDLVPLFGTAKAFVERIPRVVYELYPAGSGSPGPG